MNQAMTKLAGAGNEARLSVRRLHVFLLMLVAMAVGVLWTTPLARGLNLDETVTYWIVKDGLPQIWHRCLESHFFSLFFWLEWASVQLCGSGEIALRLPSYLSMLGTLIVVRMIAEENLGRDAAVFTMLVFAVHRDVAQIATTGRPYALGLLLTSLALLHCCSYVRTDAFKHGALMVLFGALSAYTHPYFAISFLAAGLYFSARSAAGKHIPPQHLVSLLGLLAITMLPACWVYAPLLQRSHNLVYGIDPDLARLLAIALPMEFVGAFADGLFIAYVLCGRDAFSLNRPCKTQLLLLYVWALVPPLAFFAISILTPYRIFFKRYISSMLPPLCIALSQSLVMSAKARAIAATAITVVALLTFGSKRDWIEWDDWRYAIATAKKAQQQCADLPVMLNSGLIETDDPTWLLDPARHEYLSAPLSAYPLSGSQILIPYSVRSQESKLYLASVFDSKVKGDFLYVGERLRDSYRWLDAEARRRGYTAEIVTPLRYDTDLGPAAIVYHRAGRLNGS